MERPLGLMEQSLRLYLERALAQMELLEPFGTRFSANGTPEGRLEQSLRLYLERPKGYWNAR